MSEFEEFVVARGAVLVRFALALCGDRHLAEDLVQTALAKACRKWKHADHPEAYVKKMIVNEHLAWWRRRSSRERPTEERLDRVVADPADANAERDAVRELLGTLPRKQRTVLVLRYYEDLSDDQIAALLGCSASTVRSNASRALASLRLTAPDLEALR